MIRDAESILYCLRAEFDYLWDKFGRESCTGVDVAQYAAVLENCVLNRLAEAGLNRYDCGREGVAGLIVPPPKPKP